MSLPEDLRQEYLQSLGIDSYFPRFKLPSAPEPVACQWPESWLEVKAVSSESSASSESSESSASSEIVEAINDAEKAALQSLETPKDKAGESLKVSQKVRTDSAPPVNRASAITAEIESAESATVKTEQGKSSKAKQDEVRLQLLCIRVSEDLAIINAMPHFGPKQLTNQHLKLLQNFIRACGFTLECFQVEEKPFHWPMVQGEYVDNSKAAAASALTAYLQQKMVDWQFRNLLVMGEQVVVNVYTADEELEAGENTPSLDKQDWQTFYTRSLDEILQSPTLKKEAWSVFRELQA